MLVTFISKKSDFCRVKIKNSNIFLKNIKKDLKNKRFWYKIKVISKRENL